MLAVLARDHSAYYDTELQDLPAVRRIRQPMYRGSAPEVFLPALRIAQEDPHATVVVLPSDQLVEGEARFMNYVGRAAQAVALRLELPVVMGAHPLSPDPACPWIEPGPPIEGLEAFAVRSVKRFLLRPVVGGAERHEPLPRPAPAPGEGRDRPRMELYVAYAQDLWLRMRPRAPSKASRHKDFRAPLSGEDSS